MAGSLTGKHLVRDGKNYDSTMTLNDSIFILESWSKALVPLEYKDIMTLMTLKLNKCYVLVFYIYIYVHKK